MKARFRNAYIYMEGDDYQEKVGVPFAGEYLKRYEARLAKVREIKDWRTREFDAGRPSRLGDYCRVHGLCPHCHGTALNSAHLQRSDSAQQVLFA
jgi:hypothetical protein